MAAYFYSKFAFHHSVWYHYIENIATNYIQSQNIKILNAVAM